MLTGNKVSVRVAAAGSTARMAAPRVANSTSFSAHSVPVVARPAPARADAFAAAARQVRLHFRSRHRVAG